jgi:hypothetical protein
MGYLDDLLEWNQKYAVKPYKILECGEKYDTLISGILPIDAMMQFLPNERQVVSGETNGWRTFQKMQFLPV